MHAVQGSVSLRFPVKQLTKREGGPNTDTQRFTSRLGAEDLQSLPCKINSESRAPVFFHGTGGHLLSGPFRTGAWGEANHMEPLQSPDFVLARLVFCGAECKRQTMG